MALVGTIVVGLALLIGALSGLRRGMVSEGMALVGVLLGALLATMWAERWGAGIATRLSWQPLTGRWIASMGLLWITALLAGYGSAALLPRRHVSLPSRQRLGGALLGLLNGGLLIGITLRYTQSLWYGEAPGRPAASWIRAGQASRLLVERFDLLLLAIAWSFAVISLIAMLFRLFGRVSWRRPAAPPGGSSRAEAGAGTAPTQAWNSAGGGSGAATPQPTQKLPEDQELLRQLEASRGARKQANAPGMERSFIDRPGS